jgi:uncharacterized membrane protein
VDRILHALLASAPGEPTFNASELASLTGLSGWVLGACALAAAGSLWLSAIGTRGAPTRVRVGLVALRAGFLLGLLVLLLEPGLRLMEKSREANRVVMLVDTSASMANSDEGTTRAQRAARAADQLQDDLAQRDAPFVADLVRFDKTATPLPAESLAALQSGAEAPAGDGTSLLAALRAVNAGQDARPLGGVVLFSDGADTTGLADELTPAVREEATRLGVPVHAVMTGRARAFIDIAIERIIADDFAFVRNKVTIQAVIRHEGFEGQTLPLSLREDGKPLLVRETTLNADAERTTVEFVFEPKSAGKHVYTVVAPVRPKESVAENNRLDFTLKVIRDRIRVLQVAGRPSWDERFVRRLLKENPSVDLISFFILRSPTDVSGAPSRELSLIPFPTRELFTEELHTFDVVIFQDFNYRPYNMGLYLKNVKEFVEEAGGGFVMIGGELSFSEGDYDGTPIADVLPVELLPGHGHTSTESFQPLLTPAGRSHPITDLGELASGDNPFAALPPLEGVNLVAGLAPGAESLLVHPFLNAGGKEQPVVAVREVGKGRSLAILTDSTWTWSLPHVGAGGRGDAHRRLFANALRWLIRDPELSRVKIHFERGTVGPSEDVPFEVRSFDPSYRPQGGAEVQLTLVPLDGGEAPAPLSGTTGSDGAWRGTITPPAPGAYRVVASAKRDGRAIGRAENAFVVRGARAEKLHAEPRPDVLKAITRATGGELVEPNDVTELEFKDQGVEKIHRQKTEPLWHHWLPLLLVVICASGEWYWRRRRGFA